MSDIRFAAGFVAFFALLIFVWLPLAALTEIVGYPKPMKAAVEWFAERLIELKATILGEK